MKAFTQQQQQRGPERRQSLPLQQQLTWAAIGVAAVGTATSAYGASQQKKAAKNAANAGSAQVDIAGLDQQARALARQNAADSIALEKQFTPEVEALRRQSTAALLDYAGAPDTTRDTLRSALYSDFTNNNQPLARSTLLDSAIAKASSDLALGGALDTATRNEVTRRAGATAAGVGGGLGLARDISARDLGLRSIDLANQRLATAASLGGQDQAVIQAQNAAVNQALQRRLSTAGLISDLGGQTFNERLGLAQFGQSIARPEVGLTPSSLVDLSVGNTNAANAAAANAAALQAQQGANTLGFGGQLLGLAGGLYANRRTTTPKKTSGTFVAGDTGGYSDPNILGTYYG